jgi:NAD-dependent SIR2 family protein deacetylase
MISSIARAALAVDQADALLITAGAGMGVDSGLPDFRGNEGFWAVYPPIAKLGLSFAQMANPRWFHTDPTLAWGFYGHRLNLYRSTAPHAGFAVLKRWAASCASGGFVFTSNVDGAFVRAGFDAERMVECHGAIDYLQCLRGCPGIFSADGAIVEVDESSFRARGPLPSCARCGGLARPNVLMFGDSGWDSRRTDEQEARLERWLEALPASAKLVIVECGAGTAIPTVRMLGEQLCRRRGATLIRINLREAEVPDGQIAFFAGAKSSLEAIDAERELRRSQLPRKEG